ncbi:MAG: hypothetical protein WC518_00950 [Patescibacteria group bacterium]
MGTESGNGEMDDGVPIVLSIAEIDNFRRDYADELRQALQESQKYDEQKAWEVLKEWQDPRTRRALIRSHPVYLHGIMKRLCRNIRYKHNKTVLGFVALSFIVGPERHKLYSGITAEINAQVE